MSKPYVIPTDNSFVQVLSRVVFDTSLSMGARLTYQALIEHRRDNPTCWPSQERLATMVGCRARTIRNYLKELITKGLVTVIKRGCWSKANEYQLNAVVPPPAPTESQGAVQPMRNQGGGDIRQAKPAQQYNNNNSYRYPKKNKNESGALAYFRRLGLAK